MLFRRACLLLCVSALLSACAHLGMPPAAMSAQKEAPLAAALPTLNATAPDTTNPTLWLCDSIGQIWTVQLGTYAIKFIGVEETILTDIGFDPANGNLYGVSFSEFYKVNKTTGLATPIGPLGISDANALVFDANGIAFTEGYTKAELYTINVSTGHAKPLGPTGSYKSAGDLTFYNGQLVLSGITGSSPSTDIDYIVTLNDETGAVLDAKKLAIKKLYGLASTGTNLLYGFANKSLYQIKPDAPTPAGRTVLLKTFNTKNLNQVLGLAYDGNFQP